MPFFHVVVAVIVVVRFWSLVGVSENLRGFANTAGPAKGNPMECKAFVYVTGRNVCAPQRNEDMDFSSSKKYPAQKCIASESFRGPAFGIWSVVLPAPFLFWLLLLK